LIISIKIETVYRSKIKNNKPRNNTKECVYGGKM